MDSLKQRVQQMLGYPFVLESWISALEGSYNDLSELLREARRSSDIAALTAAEDLLDDLYRQQDDQANPTAHQTYCRGRVSQMLKDVHAEVKELERLEKLELTDGQMQVLWELYMRSPQETNQLAEHLGTHRLDGQSILGICQSLLREGLLHGRVDHELRYSAWRLNDTGYWLYEQKKQTPVRAE
jgi:hypothetical protein